MLPGFISQQCLNIAWKVQNSDGTRGAVERGPYLASEVVILGVNFTGPQVLVK